MPIDAIRQATEADLDELVSLLRAGFDSQVRELGLTAETAPWHVAFRGAEDTEREMGYLTFYIIVADGRPAGCIAIQNDVEPEYGGDGYIGRVTVHPDYRRRGYARLLMTFAESALQDRGARRVRLHVLTVLDGLVEFYARQGYVEVCHHTFKEYDVLAMDKPLV